MFRSNNEEMSQNDKTFNFDYEIDISQKKDKTIDGGIQFNTFPDFKDDRTNKSDKQSNRKIIPSEILKKSEDSYMIPNQNIENSLVRGRGGSVIEDKPSIQINTSQAFHFKSAYTSPKFNQTIKQYGSVENQSKQESRLSVKEAPTEISRKPKMKPTVFKKKSEALELEPIKFTLEDEYNEMLSLIKYYEQENSKIDYECSKVEGNIEYIESQIQNPTFEHKLTQLTDETNQTNNQIQEQRSIEKCLTSTYKHLQDDFQKLKLSIRNMEFVRPNVVRDQSKAIIDQINSLKSQFQSVKRDQGSLNLSSTIQQPPISTENRMHSNQIPFLTSEQKIFDQIVSDIREIEQESSDPKYLYNIKMLFVKQEWTLYNSGQFCVQVSYRKFPLVQVRLGNKTIKDFQNFMLRQNNTAIFEQQTLSAKSFYLHQFTMSKECSPFLKLQLSHSKSLKPLTLFIPTLSLQMGEFIPITAKEYYHQIKYHSDTLQETRTAESPIDKTIIRDIEDCSIYFPNLLKDEDSCQGIFRFSKSNEGSLVRISQSGELLSFQVKNNIGNLCKALQFLFTN